MLFTHECICVNINNKKVLLRDSKRHIARGIACLGVCVGVYPLACLGGTPLFCPEDGGYPSLVQRYP